MKYLPDGFPEEKLQDADRYRVMVFHKDFVEDFYDEYKFGHFIMAAYASVPGVLTPDLLYKIWMNFNTYTWGNEELKIHRIAVSDILLSNLVRKTGFELFEMHEEIRAAFREWLVYTQKATLYKNQKIASPQQIADFLLHYHQNETPGSKHWGEGYDDIQEWTALAYISPEKSNAVVLEKLNYYIKKNQKREALRVLNLFPKIVDQIQIVHPNQNLATKQEMEQTALFTKAWKGLMENNSTYFLKTLKENPNLKKYLNDKPEGGIEVTVLESIDSEIGSISREKIYGVLVGIDKYEKISNLNSSVFDAKRMADFLRNFGKDDNEVNTEIYSLLNKEASKENVLATLDRMLDLVDNGDYFLFYFCGHALGETRFRKESDFIQKLGLVDSDSEDIDSLLSIETIAEVIFPVIEKKKAHITIVLDTDGCSGFGAFFDRISSSAKGSLQVLNACKKNESSYETQGGGAFTSSLLNNLEMFNNDISYADLIRRLRNEVKSNYSNTTPWIESFPAKAKYYGFLSDKIYNPEEQDGGIAYYNFSEKRWEIDLGAINGISNREDYTKVSLTNQNTEKPLIANITEVLLDKSIIRLESNNGVNKREQYEASVPGLFAAPINLFFKIKDAFYKKLKKSVSDLGIVSISFYENEFDADYSVFKEQEKYYLTYSGRQEPLIELKTENAIRTLESISKWTFLKNLRNENSRFESRDISVEISENETPLSLDGDVVTINVSPTDFSTEVKVKLTNTTIEDFHVGVVYHSTLFGTSTEFIQGGVQSLPPGEFIWLQDNGAILIYVQIEDYIRELNWEYETVYFQIIWSNTEFELDFNLKEQNSYNKFAITTATRGIADYNDDEPDWQTKLIEFRIKNPNFSKKKTEIIPLKLIHLIDREEQKSAFLSAENEQYVESKFRSYTLRSTDLDAPRSFVKWVEYDYLERNEEARIKTFEINMPEGRTLQVQKIQLFRAIMNELGLPEGEDLLGEKESLEEILNRSPVTKDFSEQDVLILTISISDLDYDARVTPVLLQQLYERFLTNAGQGLPNIYTFVVFEFDEEATEVEEELEKNIAKAKTGVWLPPLNKVSERAVRQWWEVEVTRYIDSRGEANGMFEELLSRFGDGDLYMEDLLVYAEALIKKINSGGIDIAPEQSGELEGLKAELLNELAAARSEKVIDKLLEALEPNNPKQNDLIFIKARLNSLENDQRKGLISIEELNLKQNQITSSLIAIINELEASDLNEGGDFSKRPQQRF